MLRIVHGDALNLRREVHHVATIAVRRHGGCAPAWQESVSVVVVLALHGGVATTSHQQVVTITTLHQGRTSAADEHVIAVATDQGVVAVTTHKVHGCADGRCVEIVIACAGVAAHALHTAEVVRVRLAVGQHGIDLDVTVFFRQGIGLVAVIGVAVAAVFGGLADGRIAVDRTNAVAGVEHQVGAVHHRQNWLAVARVVFPLEQHHIHNGEFEFEEQDLDVEQDEGTQRDLDRHDGSRVFGDHLDEFARANLAVFVGVAQVDTTRELDTANDTDLDNAQVQTDIHADLGFQEDLGQVHAVDHVVADKEAIEDVQNLFGLDELHDAVGVVTKGQSCTKLQAAVDAHIEDVENLGAEAELDFHHQIGRCEGDQVHRVAQQQVDGGAKQIVKERESQSTTWGVCVFFQVIRRVFG